MESSGTVRAFIALNLPEELKGRLGQLQRDLLARPGGRAVRWTPRAQIHLTLRFLGDVFMDAIPAIRGAVQRAAAGIDAFELATGELGCFPSPRQPRIVWIGLTGALEPLRMLQANLDRETSPWGRPEEREFHPHLTLGRVRQEHARDVRSLAESFATRPAPLPISWPVSQVDLMQSRLLPTGAEYSVIASSSLGQAG